MTTLVGKNCDGGHYICSPPKECCKQGCCYMFNNSVYKPPTAVHTGNVFNPLFLGHWYFWLAVTATVAGILCACSLWRRHSQGGICCRTSGRDERATEPDSNSCYAPPQYSRCNSFHQPPPPYSEVTSKPDLYPLVISYNGEPVIKNNSSTGYLMVQYLRNFIVRPDGTLSATSTIDSLSSTFIYNATNEANVIIPPAYSRMGSLEEVTINLSNHQHYPGETLSTPRSLSSTSDSHLHSSPSVQSHVSIATAAPLAAPLSVQNTPSRRVFSRPHSVISIRDNPFFESYTTTNYVHINDVSSTPASTFLVPNMNNSNVKNVEDSVLNDTVVNAANTSLEQNKSQNICDALSSRIINNSNVNSKKHKSKLTPKERSQESEEETQFSVLANLSRERDSPVFNFFHRSVNNSMTGSDISSLTNLDSPASPPRATSPTQEMKELLDKIQELPQQKSPISPHFPQAHNTQPETKENRSYFHRLKAKTMYVPLHDEEVSSKSKFFTKGWISRSAPNTPCGNFIPTFPTHKRNPSSGHKSRSKLNDSDDSPLLQSHLEFEDDSNAAGVSS